MICVMTITCNVYERTGVTNIGLWRLLIYASYTYDLICFSKVAHLLIKMSLLGRAGNDVFHCRAAVLLLICLVTQLPQKRGIIVHNWRWSYSILIFLLFSKFQQMRRYNNRGERHACNSANSKSPTNTKNQPSVSFLL